MTCRCFRCLRTFRPLWKWFINQDLVTEQPVVKFLSSRAAAAHRVVVPLQAFLRSLMALSELGLMYPIMVHRRQAKVIKLFILMDVDTQTHTTTRTWAPSYLSYHTPLLTPKHTNTPPDQAGREEGSQYLRSCSYLVPRSRSASHCRQTIEFSTMQLSACSVWAVLEVFTRHYVCWFVSVGRQPSLVFKRQVRPYSNTSHRHENCWFTLLQRLQTPTAVHVSLSARTFSAIVSVRCWTETGQCWFLWFCLHEEWQELQLHVRIPDF